MKKIYLCISWMMATVSLLGQTNPDTANRKYRSICVSPSKGSPLYVLNGEIVDSSIIWRLDISSITNINILKYKKGLKMYGSPGESGVVTIDTRNTSTASVSLVDAESGEDIAGATIHFRSGKEVISGVSNEKGFLQTDELRPNVDYEVIIHSIGFEPDTFHIGKSGQRHVIRKLKRRVKELEAFIIKGSFRINHRVILSCGREGLAVCRLSHRVNENTDDAYTPGYLNIARIYPNPVPRTSAFYIDLDSHRSGLTETRILSLSGEVVKVDRFTVQAGTNRIMQTTGNWAAGTYLLQVMNEDGVNMITKKIVIQ